jgi:hypothetical protein
MMLNSRHVSVMALVALLGGVFAFWRCTASSRVATGAESAAPTARLAVSNLTGYAWKIGLLSRDGAPARAVHVAEQATVEFEVRGGDYVIEQAMLNASGEPATTRRFSARFAAGETYQWRLATLLSVSPEEPPRQ